MNRVHKDNYKKKLTSGAMRVGIIVKGMKSYVLPLGAVGIYLFLRLMIPVLNMVAWQVGCWVQRNKNKIGAAP